MEIGKLYKFTNKPYDWPRGEIIAALCRIKCSNEDDEFDYDCLIVYLFKNEFKTINWGVKVDDVLPVPFEESNIKKYNFNWGKNGLSNKT